MKTLDINKLETIKGGTSGRDCLLAGFGIALGGILIGGGAWGPGWALAGNLIATNSDCWSE
ncbi:hypothetical protein [Lutibacter sp.]